MVPRVHVFPSAERAVQATARLLLAVACRSVRRRGRFVVALAGGNTPRPLYRLLATSPWKERFPWGETWVFWGDERMVPPDHPQSNFRLADETLLSHVPVPPEQVFRVPTAYPPAEAARRYEQQLRRVFPESDGPTFDMVLLGLGTDGHTASLFPGTTALQEKARWVTAVYVPRLAAWRVTLTLPALNAARRALFLVLGAAKADIVAQVLRGPQGRYPAQRVRPRERLDWFLDAEAGQALETSVR